jgi:hypothetical protein
MTKLPLIYLPPSLAVKRAIVDSENFSILMILSIYLTIYVVKYFRNVELTWTAVRLLILC